MSTRVGFSISQQPVYPARYSQFPFIELRFNFTNGTPPSAGYGLAFAPVGTNLKSTSPEQLGIKNDVLSAVMRAGAEGAWIMNTKTLKARLVVGKKTLFTTDCPKGLHCVMLYPQGTPPPNTQLVGHDSDPCEE